MTFVVVLILAALFIVVGLRQAVRGFAVEVTDPEQLLGRTQPVDLAAFSNLINPDEDAYLAAHLPAIALWRIRRSRYLAATEYVHTTAQNAAILIRLAQTARASSEVQVSEAGAHLLTLAVHTRLLAGFTMLQLYLASVMPWWRPSVGSLREAYAGVRAALVSVVMWQRPDLVSRVSEAV